LVLKNQLCFLRAEIWPPTPSKIEKQQISTLATGLLEDKLLINLRRVSRTKETVLLSSVPSLSLLQIKTGLAFNARPADPTGYFLMKLASAVLGTIRPRDSVTMQWEI
jgi:hypothetical protein